MKSFQKQKQIFFDSSFFSFLSITKSSSSQLLIGKFIFEELKSFLIIFCNCDFFEKRSKLIVLNQGLIRSLLFVSKIAGLFGGANFFPGGGCSDIALGLGMNVNALRHCRRRKARTVFSDPQLTGLEKRFENQRY